MSDTTTYALLSTAAATSVFHTLIPDHWLPFVLIGRARGWATGTVAMISGVSAVIHVALSLLLGLLAVVVGVTAVELVGETLERVSGALLILSGLAYMVWAWNKGGHFHPGGERFHTQGAASACPGDEGPEHPEHLHYHADGELIRARRGWGAFGLAVIIGLNPCVLVMPILLASAHRGSAVVSLVAIAYGLPTILLMVGLSVLGVRLGWRIRLPRVARNAEVVSGGLITLLGLVVWAFGG